MIKRTWEIWEKVWGAHLAHVGNIAENSTSNTWIPKIQRYFKNR